MPAVTVRRVLNSATEHDLINILIQFMYTRHRYIKCMLFLRITLTAFKFLTRHITLGSI